MPFLMNTWYCAGWAHELANQALVGRKILGKHVLMYRKLDGEVVAMNDACPHRFAPLHLGRRSGDTVACPYHGLEFGPGGECTRNPHGDGKIPKACKVDSYPLVERWTALWIWMGDPSKADPGRIPEFSKVMPREGWSVVYGHHQVQADYQLVVDNLLDRSHVQYLHPLLAHGTESDPRFVDQQRCEQVGDVVWDYHSQKPCGKVPFLAAVWPDAPEFTEHYFNLRWEAPGNMMLDSGIVALDSDRKVGSHTPMANLITPADENQTHYFWNQARDMRADDKELDQKIQMAVTKTFSTEDGKMIADCREMMGTADLMSLNPVLLPGDAASMRARRIMARKIDEERALA